MALRIDSRSCDADNNLGLITAARSDWHHEPADFHLGTGHQDPTHDAEYTTASVSRIRQKLSIILYLREESIYVLLAVVCLRLISCFLKAPAKLQCSVDKLHVLRCALQVPPESAASTD